MIRATNPVISTYRSHQLVETLIRVHNVTGTEFPVSGDAPLRASWETLDGPAKLLKVDPRPVQRYRNPNQC